MVQKMLGQLRNVGDTASQRRDLNVDDVDAVVEILAKASLGDEAF
jgi:hypothetical protein